jgi:hypothetical protein
MSDGSATKGLRGRLTDSAEDRLGKALTELLENPLLTGTIGRAFDARERAAQAQEVAMGALNIPSAADIERLTRRLRSVSQRLEGIEDGVHRLDVASSNPALDTRLGAIEEQLRVLTRAIGEVRESLPGARATVSHAQERLPVEHASSAATPPRAKRSTGKSRKAPAKARKPAAAKH